MGLKRAFLVIVALALSCTTTGSDVMKSVTIIEKLTQDLHSSPSGYIFHHQSDSVHPGGYNADIDHGKTKILGQLGMEKTEELNGHGKSGIYRLAGGYGFMITHDYGSQKIQEEAPSAPVHYGTSNADHASIAVLQFGGKDSLGSSLDIGGKNGYVGPEKSKGLDSYVGKDIYGPYMEYDKLVKDGKKGPSVYPEGYYESDGRDGKEKYESDDGYGESNNAGDKGRYLESEKYDGSEDYNGNERYVGLRGNGDYLDDGEADKYVIFEEHNEPEDFNGEKNAGLHEGHPDVEYNDDEYGRFEANDPNESHEAPSSSYVEYEGYNSEPTFSDVRNSFLDDFFKEYNEFTKSNVQSGFNNDHHHDNDHYNAHAVEDESSRYGEDGQNEKNFFDDADSHGDHYEQGAGEKNSHFGEKKGHKKGSKTTGFRNMLHKDEYTKDHTFYEHAKNMGHFDKAGDYDEHEHQDEGSHEKSGHHDSSLYEDHRGKTDSEDKGHSIGDDLSDNYEHGYKSYFDDHSDYNGGGDDRHGSEYESGYEV